jgi:hypothetical protein
VKLPINRAACISLDAPTLATEEVQIGGVTRWRVWCRHCAAWHYHGPAEGHREAHCQDSSSPYWRSGYNLAVATNDTDEGEV